MDEPRRFRVQGAGRIHRARLQQGDPGCGLRFRRAQALRRAMAPRGESDNVLRGGLTSKHIDVPELMKHTLFEGVTPVVIKRNASGIVDQRYPCPVPDFGISKIELDANAKYSAVASSLEIFIAIEGDCVINGTNSATQKIGKGGAVAILPLEAYTITTTGKCLLFKAFVPA